MRRIVIVVLVLLAAAGIEIESRYRHDIEAARERVASPMPHLATSLGTLEYATRGEGPPVLGIHGSGGGYDQGLEMLGPVVERGYRLVAPSRFGYLGSDMPEQPTLAKQADALAELLDALEIDRAVIMGGSAGALSAAELAARHPERCRALVLIVPAAYAPTRRPNTAAGEGPLFAFALRSVLGSDFVFWSLLELAPGPMTKMVIATDPALVKAASPSEQARVHAILEHILPVSRRTQGLLFDMATAGDPPPQALEAITCPVLTLSLSDDYFGTAAPAEYIAANVRDGRAVIYEQGGHVWVGHQDEVWRTIADFLVRVGAGPEAGF